MKMQNIALQISLLIFVMVVASCSQSTDSVTSSSTATPFLQAGSASPMPVDTITTATLPTSTTLPTLSVEDARKHLLELLASNGDCHLPCLWGITPGKSTYQEAQAILARLSALSELTGFIPEGGAISPNYVEGDLMLAINAGFNINILSESQIVSRVGFKARELKKMVTTDNGFEPVFDSQLFGERLNYYMLHQVLTQQGIPTSVMIAPHGGAAGFGILLLYPEKGILVDYSAQMSSLDTGIRGCPASAHVELELYPPGTSEFFYELLGQTDWSTRLNYYKPLEEATSISIVEFYQTFKQPTDECIETPAELWPTPVP